MNHIAGYDQQHKQYQRIAARALTLIVVCGAFIGCAGGGSPPTMVNGGSATATLDANSTESNFLRVAPDITPAGEPGIDFTPAIIELGYFHDVKLPAKLRIGFTGDLVSTRPNAILRKNSEMEAITAVIADRYRLTVRREVYLGLCNMAAFNVPGHVDGDIALADLRHDFAEVVEFAGFTPLAHAAFTPNDPLFLESTNTIGPQWGHKAVNCEWAWEYTLGSPGLLVAVADTGVNMEHVELIGQVLDPATHFPDHNLDIANSDNTMEDTDGHGTAVTGIMAAATNNEQAIAGVSPGCPMIPIKIANSQDYAPYSDMIAGCLLAAELGAKVINLSWIGEQPSVNFQTAIAQINSQGALLVVCAGNDGGNVSGYPAVYDGCISVGATQVGALRAEFSNWGPDVDIAAPGNDLMVLGRASPTSYRYWWGTSFSSPMVAGGAALLWSHAPELSNSNVRDLLCSTGRETFGFLDGSDVREMDLAAVFQQIPSITAPRPEQLIQTDQITLTPDVQGPVDSVELYVDNELALSLTAEPWTFNLDLSSYGFQVIELEFRAIGAATVSDTLTLLVDNTPGSYELSEGFEQVPYALQPLDARGYSPTLLTSLKQQQPMTWTAEDVAANGPASWASDRYEHTGQKAMRLGTNEDDYGSFETDALISTALDLTWTQEPQITYYTKHNIADSGEAGDRGTVLATTDSGLTFTALIPEGGEAYYTGLEEEYYEQSIDLSSFVGQRIHLVFLFESNGAIAGEDPGKYIGWWLDDVSLESTLLGIGDIALSYDAVPGSITGTTMFTATPVAPVFADELEYWLDFAPLGVTGGADVVFVTSEVFAAQQFDVTALLAGHNQIGALHVTPRADGGLTGAIVDVPVYVFNHRGDVNADGVVDALDMAAYATLLGLGDDSPGFNPLADGDLDTVITGLDAAYVGYSFGAY